MQPLQPLVDITPLFVVIASAFPAFICDWKRELPFCFAVCFLSLAGGAMSFVQKSAVADVTMILTIGLALIAAILTRIAGSTRVSETALAGEIERQARLRALNDPLEAYAGDDERNRLA